MDGCDQFKFLLYKNLKTKLRKKRAFFGQFIAVIFCIGLANINTEDEPIFKDINEVQINRIDNLSDIEFIKSQFIRPAPTWALGYIPTNSVFKQLMTDAIKYLKIKTMVEYTDPVDMETDVMADKLIAGIEFPFGQKNTTTAPQCLTVTLRFPPEFRTFKSMYVHQSFWVTHKGNTLNPEWERVTQEIKDMYVNEGFLQMQNALFVAYFNMIAKDLKVNIRAPVIVVNSYQKTFSSSYSLDLVNVSNVHGFIFYFLFLAPCINLIAEITREKKSNTMVQFTLYGFPHWMHWVAHFCAALIVFIVLDVTIITLLKTKWFHNHAEDEPPYIVSLLALLLFFVLHNTATILFSFMIVIICRKLRTAISITLLVWTSMYSIFSIILHCSTEFKFQLILFSLLFFNNVITYGIRVLLRVNKNIYGVLDQSMEMFYIFGVLVLDTMLYLLISYIFNRLIPEQYIENKPFFQSDDKIQEELQSYQFDYNMHETEFQYTEFTSRRNIEAIRCNHVSKYCQRKSVLRNVTLKIFENEITVILGHNGSGKTTLLCIIAGLMKPTRGEIGLYGKTNRSIINKSIYFLPHNNTLFDQLTAREHLLYVMTAKNITSSLKDFELLKWMRLLHSNSVSKTVVADMNYEQRRLLCLALALCGETRIVLLDEPTMFMTEDGRKTFWDIVRAHKRGRCIVVATNSINEAEYVGDRFAILQEGIVVANGTAFYLKIKFAGVYYLICIKNAYCNVDIVTAFISTYIPPVEIENNTSNQVIYKIPIEYANIFPILFRDLEERLAELRLDSVDVMGSQLSDVYVSFSERRSDQFIINRAQSIAGNVNFVHGKKLIRNQFHALFWKKYLLQQPDKVPTIMMAASILIMLVMGQMSKYMVAEHMRQTQIGIGFNSHSTSDGIFKRLLTSNYRGRVSKVEITVHVNEDVHSRFYTWSNKIDGCTNEENAIYSTCAIQLPGKDLTDAQLWFDEGVFHTAPLCLNLLHNILLRMAFKRSDYVLKLINKPVAMRIEDKFRILDENNTHMKLPLVIGTIMPFVISSFIIFLVDDRVSQVRTLQFVAGIRIYIYWLVPFSWDLCKIFIFNCLLTMAFLILTVDEYKLPEKLAILFIINIYGYAGLCETYLLSFNYDKTNVAYISCSFIHIFTGLFAFAVYWILLHHYAAFWWIAMLFPDFAVLDGLSMIYMMKGYADICNDEMLATGYTMDTLCDMYSFCCENTIFRRKYPGIFPAVFVMLITGTIFFVSVLIFEYVDYERRFNRHHTSFLHSSLGPHNLKEVLNIKRYITNMPMSEVIQYNMVVDQLENKIPKWGSMVNTISFAVRSKECVVILVEKNCSTKHLMHQLVGEESFSFGDIFVRGLNMKESLDAVREYLGFCPKGDALLKQCTGRQLMEIICLIRGVHKNMIETVIHDLVSLLEMQLFINTKTCELSMDKRKRINIAIAFIADVQILVIDEPTAGVSGLPRQIIWNALRYAKNVGKSVIFTTTDPWECEALADKIILFSDGEMLFYGPLQKMRTLFSNGIIFEVKMLKSGQTEEEIQDNLFNDVSNVRRFVTFISDQAELRSYLDGMMTFYIPMKPVIWSKLFDLIETNRERLRIENYIVNQAPFEEVVHNLFERRTIKMNKPTKVHM